MLTIDPNCSHTNTFFNTCWLHLFNPSLHAENFNVYLSCLVLPEGFLILVVSSRPKDDVSRLKKKNDATEFNSLLMKHFNFLHLAVQNRKCFFLFNSLRESDRMPADLLNLPQNIINSICFFLDVKSIFRMREVVCSYVLLPNLCCSCV